MELESSGSVTEPNRVNIWWATLSVVSSAATAYILSMFGWIPVNPVYATVIGSVFGMLFVFYQLLYSRELLKRGAVDQQQQEGDIL